MDYEGANNQPNTNTTAAAQEMLNNLTSAPPPKPNKLKNLLEKLSKSPLFIGKRKFVSLPLIAVSLAAIIIVPIIIINASRGPVMPMDDPAFVAWVEEVSGEIQTALDDNDGNIEEALNLVDERLATEHNPPRRRSLLNSKAALVASENRLDEAIAAMEEFVSIAEEFDSSKESGLAYLADLHYQNGDLQRALELFRQALDLAMESGGFMGNDLYVEMIEQIESELSGAAQ
jgi:tetratricopeptide (TPR) repeat protein